MPYPSYPFLADAQGAGVAAGQSTNVNVDTFAFVMQGVIAAGSAQTSSLAQSPSGFPAPEAMAGTHASATGGNTNIGSTGFIEYAAPGSAFQASNSFASTTNPFTGTFPGAPQFGTEQSMFSAYPPSPQGTSQSSSMPAGGNFSTPTGG